MSAYIHSSTRQLENLWKMLSNLLLDGNSREIYMVREHFSRTPEEGTTRSLFDCKKEQNVAKCASAHKPHFLLHPFASRAWGCTERLCMSCIRPPALVMFGTLLILQIYDQPDTSRWRTCRCPPNPLH